MKNPTDDRPKKTSWKTDRAKQRYILTGLVCDEVLFAEFRMGEQCLQYGKIAAKSNIGWKITGSRQIRGQKWPFQKARASQYSGKSIKGAALGKVPLFLRPQLTMITKSYGHDSHVS